MSSQEVRAKLREKFSVTDVKQREGAGRMKLDYIAGETVIQRLIEATADSPNGYAWQSQVVKIDEVERKKRNGETYQTWVAAVQGTLLIEGDAGSGVGAMENHDLDMALKSANTEALKNAAKNGFGVGLELWDKEYRETLSAQRRLLAGDEQAAKQAVWDIAKAAGANDSAAVAKHFDVSVGDLSDIEVLRDILKNEGVL